MEALQSYLTLSPLIEFEVEVRNFAVGATGPKFTYYCNQLHGDEDIVIFDNVRPSKADSVFDVASSLMARGMGVVLVNWHGIMSWSRGS